MGKKKKRKKKKICPHRAFTPNQVALPPACGGVHCSLATVPTTPYSLPHTKEPFIIMFIWLVHF